MVSGHKRTSPKKALSKRVVIEIAPGVRAMLDAYLSVYNDSPERVSSPLKYTDVVNQALDEFLPRKPTPEEQDHD